MKTWKAALGDVGSWEEEPAVNRFPDPQAEENDEPEEEEELIGMSTSYKDLILYGGIE